MKKALLLAAALLFGMVPAVGAQSPPMTPIVDFSMSNFFTSENSTSAEITVYLMGNAGGNTVTVNYATADGSATAGADYVATSGTLTFPPGTYSKSFWVTIKPDLFADPNETVVLTLSNAVNASIGINSPATLTIYDSPPPTVQFSMSSYSQSENMITANIDVSLMGNTGGNTVTVKYATADGTATAGADYVATSGTLNFPPGTYSQSFSVTLKKDLINDPNETVLLSLSSPTNAVLGMQNTATLMIMDSPPPTVQFSTSSYSQSENMITANIDVSLMGDTGGNTVTVKYATADGTATAGADYVATSGTLNFPPGTYSQSFSVTLKKDLINDPNETVLLSLSSPTNAVLGMQNTATLMIMDNPPPTVQFSMSNYSQSENMITANIDVSLMGDTGGNTVTVKYVTADGTATAGADYVATSGTLSFPPGTYSQSFSITLKKDLVNDPNETVLLSLSSPTNAVLGMQDTATLTIMDSPPPTVQYSMTSYSVSENGGTAGITVTLMGDTGGETVKVDYATADGTATAGSDYNSTSGTLEFANGAMSQTFYVTVKRDVVVESTETVALTLSNAVNAAIGTNSTATLSIWDTPPVITVNPGTSNICAGAKQTGPHQTLITATLTDGMTPFSGETVSFETSAGSLSVPSAPTDSMGIATTVLTSSEMASEEMPIAETDFFKATVSASAGGTSGVSGNCKVEFQPTIVNLTTTYDVLVSGEITNLETTVTWSMQNIATHSLGWRISQIWDENDNLIYDGSGSLPSGFGTISNGSSQTNGDGKGTATYEAGEKGGTVELESSDESVMYCFTFKRPRCRKKHKVIPKAVLVFIRQKDNSTIPNTGNDGCHLVSKFQTDVELPETATFDGPSGAARDLDTFRVQATKLVTGKAPKIKLEVLRGGDVKYTGDFDMVEGNPGEVTYRSNKHVRLVSNDIDDAHRAEQTAKVELGDTVRAKLTLDGKELGTVSLDVGRPTAEAGNNAIRKATCNFIIVDYKDVKAKADVPVILQKSHEAWMQCCIKVYKSGEPTVVTPVKNIFEIKTDATGGGNFAIKIDGTDIAAFAIAADGKRTPYLMAQDIAAGINAVLGAGKAHAYNSYPGSSKAHVVVKKGSNVTFANIVSNVPGTTFTVPVMDITDNDIDDDEEFCLAANYGGNNRNIMDMFIVKTLTSGNRADACPPSYAPIGATSDMRNTCWISLISADGVKNVHTTAHEAGRFILDFAGLDAGAVDLMNSTSETDSISARRRLTPVQHAQSRTASEDKILKKLP